MPGWDPDRWLLGTGIEAGTIGVGLGELAREDVLGRAAKRRSLPFVIPSSDTESLVHLGHVEWLQSDRAVAAAVSGRSFDLRQKQARPERSGTRPAPSGTCPEWSGTRPGQSGIPLETSGTPLELSGTCPEWSGTCPRRSGIPLEWSGTPLVSSGHLMKMRKHQQIALFPPILSS